MLNTAAMLSFSYAGKALEHLMSAARAMLTLADVSVGATLPELVRQPITPPTRMRPASEKSCMSERAASEDVTDCGVSPIFLTDCLVQLVAAWTGTTSALQGLMLRTV